MLDFINAMTLSADDNHAHSINTTTTFNPHLGVSIRTIATTLTPEAIIAIEKSAIQTFELSPEIFNTNVESNLKQQLLTMLSTKNKHAVSWHIPYGSDYDLSSPDSTVRQAAIRNIRRQLAYAKYFNCRLIVIHSSPESFLPNERQLRVKMIRQSLEELRDNLRQNHQQMALEFLPRACMGNSADELFAMLEGMDDTFGICLDVNHYMDKYRQIPDDIHRCNKRLLSLHLSDYDGIDEGHWLPEPGKGVVDWQGIMQALADINYSGPFNFEVKTKTGTPAQRISLLEKCYSDFMLPIYKKATRPVSDVSGNIVCAEQKNCEILIMKPFVDWSLSSSVIWRWSPRWSADISEKHHAWFENPSDCKGVAGTHLLTVASGGAVALVRIFDKKTVFYAYVGGNPHSAELLPDGNIVSASSNGNFIKLLVRQKPFSGPENVKSVSIPYHDAHGIVWEDKQQLLWVLGYDELTSFKYNFQKENPQIEKVEVFRPTDEAFIGHDLFPIPGTRSLYLSGKDQVMEFDTVSHKFKTVLEMKNVKSISHHTENAKIIFQIPKEQWWNDTIRCISGEEMTRPGAKFYKARWLSDQRKYWSRLPMEKASD